MCIEREWWWLVNLYIRYISARGEFTHDFSLSWGAVRSLINDHANLRDCFVRSTGHGKVIGDDARDRYTRSAKKRVSLGRQSSGAACPRVYAPAKNTVMRASERPIESVSGAERRTCAPRRRESTHRCQSTDANNYFHLYHPGGGCVSPSSSHTPSSTACLYPLYAGY